MGLAWVHLRWSGAPQIHKKKNQRKWCPVVPSLREPHLNFGGRSGGKQKKKEIKEKEEKKHIFWIQMEKRSEFVL